MNHKKNNDYCKLFGFIENWQYMCEALPETKQQELQTKRNTHIIKIQPDMFLNSNTTFAKVGKLINLWTTEGIHIHSPRVWRSCPEANEPLFKPAPAKKTGAPA